MTSGKQQVDAYIAAAPAKARPMLRTLRRIVRTSAPRAEERLSYKMPYYAWHGRLAYFAAFQHHVSFYVMGRVKTTLAKELKPYRTTAATLRFPFGTRIPVALMTRVVKGRLRELEEGRRKP